MKIASLDIGTNSFILLIAEIVDGAIIPIHQEFEIPRLGENLAKNHLISNDAIIRSVEVLNKFKIILQKYNPEIILPIATAVLRDSGNAEEVQRILSDTLGKRINVICGEEEASYSFWGIMNTLKSDSLNYSTIDIGGGSTEIISGNVSKINFSVSLPIGAAKLRDLFFNNDTYDDIQIEKCRQNINSTLAKLNSANINTDKVIGVGGTITTLAFIKSNSEKYDSEMIDNIILNLDDLSHIFNKIRRQSPEEISQTYNIHRLRADILLPGLMILEQMMNKIEITELSVSSRGLRFGIIRNYLNNISNI